LRRAYSNGSAMATIIVLDGNESTRVKISESFRQRNHHVEGFARIAGVEEAMSCGEPDLLILEA